MPEIRKGGVGDFIRGADTWIHSNQMFIFSLAWIVLPGVAVSITIGIATAWIFSDKCSIDAALYFFWGNVQSLASPFSSISVGECFSIEGRTSIPAKIVAESAVLKESFIQVLGDLGRYAGFAFLLYVPVGLMIVKKSALRGKEIKGDKYIRGAKLVAEHELSAEVTKLYGESDLKIGNVFMPADFPKKHTLISGTTGAGKTTALIYLLRDIRARGDRAVVYDKKGEFVEMFYRDGIDHILNPADSRSQIWTPWQEMYTPFDADWIAETLIADNNGSGGGDEKFFKTAARSVISAVLQTLYIEGPRSLLTLLRATAWNDRELLKNLVAGTPAETYFNENNERTLESIISTIVDGVRPFRLLSEDDNRGCFSIREWIAEGDRAGSDDSWLFLPVRESEIEVQKPLISTWIQSVAKGLMAQDVNNKRLLWLVVDELPSLKKIPALPMLMAEGRGFGAAVVIGIQEINQLEEEFGKNISKTILGLCSTQLHFRLNNVDTAEWVSKALGEAEREERDEDVNYSADEIRDGVRLSSKRQKREIVLPAEIMDLPDLTCFIKLWGVEPKAKIHVPYIRLPQISEGFVMGDPNRTLGMRLLNAARLSRSASQPQASVLICTDATDSEGMAVSEQAADVFKDVAFGADFLIDPLGGSNKK